MCFTGMVFIVFISLPECIFVGSEVLIYLVAFMYIYVYKYLGIQIGICVSICILDIG